MDKVLDYGTYHLTVDPAIHRAAWGARLIYKEVEDGQSGIVFDRCAPWGDQHDLTAIIAPNYERAMKSIRSILKYGDSWGGPDETGHIVWRDGLVVLVASPQGSAGYLYVTIALETPRTYGMTQIAPVTEGVNCHEVGCGTPWFTRHIDYLRDEVRNARQSGPSFRAKDAQSALDAFENLWPAVPDHGPTEPVTVIDFPYANDNETPRWLKAIHNSQNDEIALDQTSPFVKDIAFETPAISWDGEVSFAEVYSIDGNVVVRNFLREDHSATWEVYDPSYVRLLTAAAKSAGGTVSEIAAN